MDQDPLGKPGRRVWKQGPLEVWARDLEDGSKAVGLFNRGEGTVEVRATWADLGLSGQADGPRPVAAEGRGCLRGPLAAPVGRHGVVLVKLTRMP